MGLSKYISVGLIATSLAWPCMAQAIGSPEETVESFHLEDSGWTERLRHIRVLQQIRPLREVLDRRSEDEFKTGNSVLSKRFDAASGVLSLMDATKTEVLSDYLFGWTLWSHGCRSDAQSYIDRALANGDLPKGDIVWALTMSAQADLDNNRSDDARRKLVRALSIKPRWAPALQLQSQIKNQVSRVKL